MDDEAQRRERRSIVNIQKKMNSFNASNADASVSSIGDEEIENHFDVCLKMYAENKINIKNAWQLRVIEYMKTMVKSTRFGKDSLKVASSSLDVSAKVYGIRVDDIYTEGFKLASQMSQNAKKNDDAGDLGDDGGPSETGEEVPAQKVKKKKKMGLNKGAKHCVAKDINTLVGNVQKGETPLFLTQTNAKLSAVDNYFTARLNKERCGTKFALIGKANDFVNCDDTDEIMNINMKLLGDNQNVTVDICPCFRDFALDVWDPENDEFSINKTMDDLLLDGNGLPIPELDGSIRDIFEPADDLVSSGEEEENPEAQLAIRGEVASIVDMRPVDQSSYDTNDYLYQSLEMPGRKMLSQIWAGPSHWKLKHIRQRPSLRFSGVSEKAAGVPQQKKRTKKDIAPLVFNEDLLPQVDFQKKVVKRKLRINDPEKVQTPINYIPDMMKHLCSFMMKPFVADFGKFKKTQPANDDYEVGPYNYGNPNDSQYCPKSMEENADDCPADMDVMDNDCGGGFEEEEEIEAQNQQFIGENLIDMPEMVQNIKINYATHSKKIDMKKLKANVWKVLIKDKSNEQIITEDMAAKEAHNINFSEIYKKLPTMIPKKMEEELSCPLAFFALLHLANEQNLKLLGSSDMTDIMIEQDYDR
ncbi:PREDICTED: condensin complex subunit 2 isoform X2 [Nicrophorus vespilloides]|nr:PREDICTED: condensin complex subunit 2 isoform X2 [Nicrophorus vespilloides]